MALYGVRVQTIGRSAGRSGIAAASYRSGEKLWSEREERFFHKRRDDVVHSEILLPANAPDWLRKLDRNALWNSVEQFERRSDAQICRELRITIPREFDPEARIRVVRDFVQKSFVDRGMVADISWHLPMASDGQPNPHCHVMLTMRPALAFGWGPKSRHDLIPDPSGRLKPNGRPVMISSNPDSWNDPAYYMETRARWAELANKELERIGSSERIDHRSYAERGIDRVAQPILGIAGHMKRLYGSMRERWSIFQTAKHHQAVQARVDAAFHGKGNGSPSPIEHVRRTLRFVGWIERQIASLAPDRRERGHRSTPDQGVER